MKRSRELGGLDEIRAQHGVEKDIVPCKHCGV